MAATKSKASGTVTRKGQVTIPVEMRKALGLEVGDRVEFSLEGNKLTVSAQESVVDRTAGIFADHARLLGDETPSAGELREIAIDAWVEDVLARPTR